MGLLTSIGLKYRGDATFVQKIFPQTNVDAAFMEQIFHIAK